MESMRRDRDGRIPRQYRLRLGGRRVQDVWPRRRYGLRVDRRYRPERDFPPSTGSFANRRATNRLTAPLGTRTAG